MSHPISRAIGAPRSAAHGDALASDRFAAGVAPDFELRSARDADCEAVFAIYMHEDVVPYLGHDPMPLDAFRPIFRELLEGGTFFVADAGGKVLGFCRATRQSGRARHVALIGTFAVSPAARGGGLARALIERVIEGLRDEGVLRVELMLERDNPRALAFYRKLGFALEGTLRGAYKRAHQAHYVDELLMAKWLVPLPDATPG
jgi:putative acetyltransferase